MYLELSDCLKWIIGLSVPFIILAITLIVQGKRRRSDYNDKYNPIFSMGNTMHSEPATGMYQRSYRINNVGGTVKNIEVKQITENFGVTVDPILRLSKDSPGWVTVVNHEPNGLSIQAYHNAGGAIQFYFLCQRERDNKKLKYKFTITSNNEGKIEKL
ncbi:hypothetical protein [Owenweeksia hongkongensis]|uniref:hypothetical protein n=1 Tax=Owenweeksia hongkongensis TaxID=253245 RepID=UPI003A923AA0